MAEVNAVETMQNDTQIEADLAAKLFKQEEPVEDDALPKRKASDEDGEPEPEAKATGDSQAEDEEDGPLEEEFEFEGKVYAAPKELKEARTADLLHAMQALSQLSYTPVLMPLVQQSQFQSRLRL